jgi:hypothetical protein
MRFRLTPATRRPRTGDAAGIAGDAAGIAVAVTELMFFWDYDTQWGADRSRLPGGAKTWGPLEFSCTDEVLRYHEESAIPACFAVVGAAARPGRRPYHDPAQIRHIHRAGHEVASHSMRHEWLPGMDHRQLRQTLAESKDALEQCIGHPVEAFVPPFNQPFDHAPGWSFSLSERRQAGPHRITLQILCETLAEAGYRFCRVAHAPLTERIGEWLGVGGFRPSRPLEIAGITCVRVGPCGFGTDLLTDLVSRAVARAPVAVYAHPHSLHRAGSQSVDRLRPTLALAADWVARGQARCLRPGDLVRRRSLLRSGAVA